MALLYGRAGRLTAQNGGFRPGQYAPGGRLPRLTPRHVPAGLSEPSAERQQTAASRGWRRVAQTFGFLPPTQRVAAALVPLRQSLLMGRGARIAFSAVFNYLKRLKNFQGDP